ncbi:beta-Ig-H3/fasciclin [Streptomyces sp. NPDC047841]|uniref:beta-Ig-H3/fasciclin n=1 Tax=Streptomyces sp. NPDC047841 TaxID=3154708 RepID=UPI003453B0CB
MRLRRNLAAAAAATAVVSGMFAASSPAAYAAGGTAPACIARFVSGTQDGFLVGLTNNCGKTMRVQVIVSYAPDSPCYTLGPGAHQSYYYEGILGLYDRTAVC